ncbi:Protein of unknown function [Cotesia congregata]|uniref:Helix-turn-helix domain-containing protein n=1 Tax=Cotesia congregata TaxID=51543 RepID=A0A8J2MSM5_COTCN|nr:Protein of unknown function [Cotesia congregata]
MKDSYQFVDRIKSIVVNNDYQLISLDVVSLFTNVKRSLIIKIIDDRWEDMKEFVNLDRDLFIDLVNFCFDSGHFLFQKNYYLQKEGCGMGSPASPQKLGVAQGFFNRAIRLSHESMVSISINKVRHLLLNNNYPRSVVDKCQKGTVDRVKNMFFIKVFDCVNYRSDTQSLSSSYCDIIESVKCLFR